MGRLSSNSINGVRVGTIKKMAEWFFGEHFELIKKDFRRDTVVVYVKNESSSVMRREFTDQWEVDVKVIESE